MSGTLPKHNIHRPQKLGAQAVQAGVAIYHTMTEAAFNKNAYSSG
jgi:hypothetical protein